MEILQIILIAVLAIGTVHLIGGPFQNPLSETLGMRYDQTAIRGAQVLAFETLAAGSKNRDGNYAIKPVRRSNISAPSVLVQELPYVATQNNYEFDFGSRAAAAIVGGGVLELNNTRLGENDIFCFYGVQLLIGVGLTINNRVYATTGTTADDDEAYNGNVTISFASLSPIKFFSSKLFRDADTFQQYAGMELNRPVRIFTGNLSEMIVRLELPVITGLTLEPNSVLSMRLLGGIGVA